MPRKLVSIIPVLLISGSTILAVSASSAAAPDAARPPEARLEQRIAGELEQGQVAAAQLDAETAVKRFPDSPVLRRRHGQVGLCRAIELGEQFQQALTDGMWAQSLGHVVDWLNTSDIEAHGKAILDKGKVVAWNPPTPEQRQALERFRTFVSGSVVTGFQEKALRELADSQSLLEQRSQALAAAFDDLKAVRKLGDTGTELELTDLWSRVLVLFWREEPPKLQRLGPTRVAMVTKAIAPFDAIKPEEVLRAAAQLAKSSPDDPTALAGAADVMSVVAGIMKKEGPLQDYLRHVLDRGYLQNGAAYDPLLSSAIRQIHRTAYLQMRDAKYTDVVAEPAAVVLQLYNQALQHDAGYSLPFLRLRLYLLRLAFDREAAAPLLEEIRNKEPGNAVVPLEEARAALLLDGQPLEAVRLWQQATRLPVFSRSYLVAVPAVLRPALKFQSELREWIGQAWPGYGWIFSTMIRMEHAEGSPGLTRAELQLYEQLEKQVDLPGLRLGLAQRLSPATDYADQAMGIQWLLGGLDDRVHQAEKQQLPPDQLAAVKKQQAEAQRAFASFPRPVAVACVTMQGLEFRSADQSLPQDTWPRFWVFQPGYFMFAWGPHLGPTFVGSTR